MKRHSLSSPVRLPAAKAVAAAAIAVCMLGSHPLLAQQATITPNYRDADLAQIVDAVSAITGKNFIIDPRVRAQVTMLSSSPMSPDAFYEAFLSILQVHGFTAVETGNIVRVIPMANARTVPSVDLPAQVSSTSDEIVTQVITVRNISAVQLVPILRPLIPQEGHLVASPSSNVLIISDRANNVNRIMRIIQRIDQAGDGEIDIIPLQNATAGEIVRVVNTLFTAGAQAEGGGTATAVRVVADDRSNSVLVTGESSQRLRIKTLITHLDTPLESAGDTQVRYLHYADAESIAASLREQIQGVTQAPASGNAAPAAGPAAADRNVTIWADIQTNALVITAPPTLMRQVMSIVDRLDIRRAQVQVEAILVEISSDKASELGLNWAVEGSNSSGETIPLGVFNQAVGGVSLIDILRGIDDPRTLTTTPNGLTLGGGRFQDSGTNFAVIMRALRGDANTNIISTPSIVTMDNQEAEIKIAQEVPFITGQYTGTSGNNNGSVNPFQTIQRQEVGTILKITPQINDSDSVLLKIEQEASSLAQGTAGAVDLITNKRTINTQVLVDNGGIIVLGGLIEDNLREGESRVPFLGAIPLIGELFKTRNVQKVKTNLMVFIRPTIIRDGVQAAFTTNSKYNLMRDQQLERRNGTVTLLPGERQPTLPPASELSRYADPSAGAEAPADQATQADPDPTAQDAGSPSPRRFGPR